MAMGGEKAVGVVVVAAAVGLLLLGMVEAGLVNVNADVEDLPQNSMAIGKLVGLVLTARPDEKALLASSNFVPDPFTPFLTRAGRKYHIGRLNNVEVVWVRAGDPLAAVSVTVQILIDHFRVGAIISTGSATSLVHPGLSIGDVAFLHHAAYTGVWKWQAWKGEGVSEELNVTLKVGDYNLPESGDNKLASIDFQPVTRFTPFGSSQKIFWFPVPATFRKLASQLQDIELEKCAEEETSCLKEPPKVVLGLKGGSSDIYLLNEAYGNFLHDNFGISTVDRQSAAVGATAYANGVPFAIFRGVSAELGKASDKKLIALAAKNSLNVAATFAQLLTSFISNNYYHAA